MEHEEEVASFTEGVLSLADKFNLTLPEFVFVLEGLKLNRLKEIK